jgi:hypothetical protein
MAELSIYTFERAQERAKTDKQLADGIARLERLNIEEQSLARQLRGKRQEYMWQERAIADHMNEYYPEDNPVHDHQ